MAKNIRVSVTTPRTMPMGSFIFLRAPAITAIGVLATINPTRYMYKYPGKTMMVPKLVPAKYPMAHPKAVATVPISTPNKMLTTKITTGAKFMVESGGGSGMAIMVVTAINAAIIAVKETFLDGEMCPVKVLFLFTVFSLRQYYLVQVQWVDDDSVVLSAGSCYPSSPRP